MVPTITFCNNLEWTNENLATYSNQIMESYNCYLILLWAYFEANNMQTLYNAIHGGKSSLYSKNLQQFIWIQIYMAALPEPQQGTAAGWQNRDFV